MDRGLLVAVIASMAFQCPANAAALYMRSAGSASSFSFAERALRPNCRRICTWVGGNSPPRHAVFTRSSTRTRLQRNGSTAFVLQASFSSSSSSTANVITSTKSTTVKLVQSLSKKSKKRTELGQTVVEGPRMVLDLLHNPRTRTLVRQILVDDTERLEGYITRDDEILVQVATPQVLKACSDTVTPQGMIAIVDMPKYKFEEIEFLDKSPLFLILDGVSDPGNVGTLIRSCLAAGGAGVILLPGSCDAWNPKAVRSAMSASFQLPIVTASSWENALDLLPASLSVVYASTMDEGNKSPSVPYYQVPWSYTDSAKALVIGSEGAGLSRIVRDDVARGSNASGSVSVQSVHVPMQAESVESLNAAVCGSVILFEYARQKSVGVPEEK